jgi:type VI secretion system protein ImpA
MTDSRTDGPRTLPVELAALLEPVPGSNPCGTWLRFDPLYDKIREARREDDPTLPQGIWQVEFKRADWATVSALCAEALAKRSKDLQIAAWLTEALFKVGGFAGLRTGIDLMRGLCERYWDGLYPLPDDGDYDGRLSPVRWLNDRLIVPLRLAPITAPDIGDAEQLSWDDWEAAERLENAATKNRGLIEQAEAEGTVTKARFLTSVSMTPKAHFSALADDLAETLASAAALEALLNARCGAQAPTLATFKGVLMDIERFARAIADEKGTEEPIEPEETMPPPEPEIPAPFLEAAEPPAASVPVPVSGRIAIRNREEAYRVLDAAADYLMQSEPHSPTPYLVKRAVSWGRMSLSELINEFMRDGRDLVQVYQLLGIVGPR